MAESTFERDFEQLLLRYVAAHERPFDPASITAAAVVRPGFGWPPRLRLPLITSWARPLLQLTAVLAVAALVGKVVLGSFASAPAGHHSAFATDGVIGYTTLQDGRSLFYLVDPKDGGTPVEVGAADFCPQRAGADNLMFAQQWSDTESSRALMLVSTDGTNVRGTGLQIGDVWAVSPDGSLVAETVIGDPRIGNPDEIWLTSVATGQRTRLVAAKPNTDLWYGGLRWSPDGHSIAYDVVTSQRTASGSSSVPYRVGLEVVNVASGQIREVSTRTWSSYSDFAWSPDGSSLAYPGLPDGVAQVGADGQLTTEAALYVTSIADGGTEEQLTQPFRYVNGVSWSPDGSAIAFISSSDGVESALILVSSTDALARYRAGPATGSFAWSPDGHEIADVSAQANTLSIIDSRSLSATAPMLSVSSNGSDGGMFCPMWLPPAR